MATVKNSNLINMLSLLNNINKLVFIDIETTGYSPMKGSRIIEIGAVKYENGEVVDTYEQLINPEQKIPTKITEVTGISNEMVKNAPIIGEVFFDFYDFINGCTVVIQNKSFDWDRFLVYYFKLFACKFSDNVIDTIELSKCLFKKEKKHNLEALCERLVVVNDNSHRALSDAKATGECFYKILNYKNELEKIKNEIEDISQLSLLEQNPVSELETNIEKLCVRSVNYWERKITPKKIDKRIYVHINDKRLYGTIYFDVCKRIWYNKDFPSYLDFKYIENLVLKFLNLQNIDDLCSFRN